MKNDIHFFNKKNLSHLRSLKNNTWNRNDPAGHYLVVARHLSILSLDQATPTITTTLGSGNIPSNFSSEVTEKLLHVDQTKVNATAITASLSRIDTMGVSTASAASGMHRKRNLPFSGHVISTVRKSHNKRMLFSLKVCYAHNTMKTIHTNTRSICSICL